MRIILEYLPGVGWLRPAAFRPRAPVALGLLLLLSLPACGGGGDARPRVVAAVYPLAWAARQVGGGRVVVADLTPPGGEAHDTTLTAAQRADVQTAALVLLLGRFGFQAEVERASLDAEGLVADVTRGMDLLPGGGELPFDPHVWLDPARMADAVAAVADGLATVDPDGAAVYEARARDVATELADLDVAYRAGLAECRFRAFVASHEFFGYPAARYGLEQLGLRGQDPQSEPSAVRVERALAAIRTGRAAPVVFYEATGEGRRVAEAVAADAGAAAVPLSALEAPPARGDYLSVMRENLERLREGLSCR